MTTDELNFTLPLGLSEEPAPRQTDPLDCRAKDPPRYRLFMGRVPSTSRATHPDRNVDSMPVRRKEGNEFMSAQRSGTVRKTSDPFTHHVS